MPCSSAVSGMVLWVSPLLNRVTATTALSSGSSSRAINDWSACVIWQPTAIGSRLEMRVGGVAALALDGDAEVVHGGGGEALAHQEPAQRHPRAVVQAEHALGREALEQALVEHPLAAAVAAADLLGRLKDQVDGAVEAAGLGQVPGRAEQHGGVAVMAAGVHRAGVDRRPGQAGCLLDRQGVHIGAQADRARPRSGADHADHAGLGEPGVHLVDAERRAASRPRTRRWRAPRSRARDGHGDGAARWSSRRKRLRSGLRRASIAVSRLKLAGAACPDPGALPIAGSAVSDQPAVFGSGQRALRHLPRGHFIDGAERETGFATGLGTAVSLQ